VSIAVSYCGAPKEGERVLKKLRSFRPVVSDDVKAMPYLAFQQRGAMPPTLRFHVFLRSAFLTELTDAAIDVLAAKSAAAPAFTGNFVIECVHGKAARTPVQAAAFPHRFAGHNFSIHGDWINPSDQSAATQWGMAFWEAMRPYARPAVYTNYLADEGHSRVLEGYGENYQRLAVLKKKYDPSNLFNLNQNVLPAV
jgi:FAD/FMN-containing dehydrogenase